MSLNENCGGLLDSSVAYSRMICGAENVVVVVAAVAAVEDIVVYRLHR